MKKVTYWKVTLAGKVIGIVARCGYCHRILDGHWLSGWHDVMLAFMSQSFEDGGCDECVHPHR